ncbi:Clp1/GlmU family protein [Thermococcus pacificus]|uniref:polynucleotide 5'-hydroxyl-kinase n=1 Tax=Thermococcus pacificus TaxID=71998 RepID=A0A218P6R6_9EURY|nr:Clp1/GlmU family protein [Thermococcus pacificus]ASJ06476.1 polyhydroxyalkanoate depolymerase [Thermococcus pacificus]
MNKATYTTDVPGDRLSLLETLSSRQRPTKVMLIGGTDSGKTTLLTFLANGLIERGLRVAIVDSDVGQKGVLPPAAISLAFPEGPFSNPSELRGAAHYFIGTTSPGQYAGEMAVGVKRLVDIAIKSADIVLIDTTGFVTGPGAEMKRLKAELVRPDIVVFLEKGGELEHLRNLLAPYGEILRLPVSPKVRAYSREERREIRGKKWRAYFAASTPVDVDLREVIPGGTSLFQGRPLTPEEVELLSSAFGWLVLAGWKGGRYTVVKSDVESSPRHYDRFALHAVDFEKLSNLLVGFIDGDGLCLGVGILKWISFSARKAQVLTPLSPEEVSKAVELRFGRIRVLENGEELGLLRRDEL